MRLSGLVVTRPAKKVSGCIDRGRLTLGQKPAFHDARGTVGYMATREETKDRENREDRRPEWTEEKKKKRRKKKATSRIKTKAGGRFDHKTLRKGKGSRQDEKARSGHGDSNTNQGRG